jgi:hypothetical protein
MSVVYASIVMSCVALRKAIATALIARNCNAAGGRANVIAAIAAASASCVTSIHPLRRPRNGKENRSTNGDHKNFNE